MNLTDRQADDLADLHAHWGTVYSFSTDGETWSACPVTNRADVLTAESAEEIRIAIREHYAAHPELQRRPRDHDLGRCWCGDHHLPGRTDTE